MDTQARSSATQGLTDENRELYGRIPVDIQHIPHNSFELPNTEETLFGETETVQREVPKWINFLGAPEETKSVHRTTERLTEEKEAHLFLWYNYTKYRLGKLTERQAERPSTEQANNIILWYQRAKTAQADIVNANLGLVIAMAKRTKIPHIDFLELISEGNMILLRAIEKFDISRGFRFSTYACRAILKGYNRIATKSKKYRQQFRTDYDPELEPNDNATKRHDEQKMMMIEKLNEILTSKKAGLTDSERCVITQRFALDSSDLRKKKTLEVVAINLGISKERVRKIQKAAIKKLKRQLKIYRSKEL
jgi:RNA polymerase sigma factor (sigma-70 family)